MIEIDGSHGEGGGSLLRQSIALSLLTKKPFRITNIRSSRPKPGLNYQHLASIELAQKVSTSKVVGANLGSTLVEFYPGELISKDVSLDIESAGSTILALQSVFVPCLLSEKKFKINIKGGTDVAWSPPFDYFKEVFLPSIEQYGKSEIQLIRRGYYPKGKGEITLQIKENNQQSTQRLERIELDNLILIKCIISTSKNFWKNTNAEKTAELAKFSLSGMNVKVNVSSVSYDSDNEGAGFVFYGVFENKKNKEIRLTRVGVGDIAQNEDELIDKIEKSIPRLKNLLNNKISCDEYLGDQLIPFIGLFGGEITVDEISEHIKSNIYLTELFLDKKFKITEQHNIKKISC